MARFESQSQLLLLWNLDPFARWQAQVRRSWITKALIQSLFCRLWSEVQLAFGAPELCFLRGKRKWKNISTIALVAQRRKCNFSNDLISLLSRERGEKCCWVRPLSLLARTGLLAHSNIIKAATRSVFLRYRSAYSSCSFGTSWCGSISDDIRQMKAEARTSRISSHRSRHTMIKVGPRFLAGRESSGGGKSDADP